MSILSQIDPRCLRRLAAAMVARPGEYADLFLERTAHAVVLRDGRSGVTTWHGASEGAAARWLEAATERQISTGSLREEALRALVRREAPGLESDPAPRPGTADGPPEVAALAGEVARYLEDVEAAALAGAREGALFSARAEVRFQRIAVATSEGEVAEDGRHWIAFTARLGALRAPAGTPARGVCEGGGGRDLGRLRELHPPSSVGAAMARSLREMEEAAPAPSGETSIVLAPGAGGIFFHESCGHALEADSALRGRSAVVELLGERVGPQELTLVDDPTVPGLAGSFRIDDEGWPAGRNVLIDSGRLVGLMLDRATALRAGMPPTGNARRESYRDRPLPRMTNTFLCDGPHPPEEILASVRRGVYVAELGNGEVDTASGDFSFRVRRAYLIAGGRAVAPIGPAIISGNGVRALRGIRMIGRDLCFDPGTGECGKEGQRARAAVGQPTLRVDGLAIRPEGGA
ncbi:MAG: TldD/PmbA family protein [Acidobacteriota bacterium]